MNDKLAILPAPEDDPTILDHSLAIGKWELAETGLAAAKYSTETAIRACAGMKLRGMPTKEHKTGRPLLYYDIPYGQAKGQGLNAEVARALVSVVGNFETIDVKAEEGLMLVPEIVDGEPHVERLHAVRATARVRDIATGTVNIGQVEEPMFGKNKDGDWFARQKVAAVARAKATRDARLEHFAAIRGGLLEAIVRETAAGHEYFSGDPGSLRGSELVRDTIMQEREAQGAVAVGALREKELLDRYGAIQTGMTTEDLAWMNGDYAQRVTPMLQEGYLSKSPETIIAFVEAWLEEMEERFAPDDPAAALPDAPEPPENPSELPTSSPGKMEAPDASVIRQTLKSIEQHRPGATAEIFAKTKLPESGEWQPEQAQALWDAAQPYLKEAIEGE